MIFLASPYTHQQSHVMQGRYIAACHAAATLANEGFIVYSPIVHWHMPAVLQNMPRDFSFWDTMSYAMLDKASECRVLKLEGWEQSFGVMREISHANLRGIPVTYMEEDDIKWLG